MKRFKNILVGVDLSQSGRFVSDSIAPPSEAAVQRALWLAGTNDAQVRFMYVLDASTIEPPSDELDLPETFSDQTTTVSRAQQVLSKLVENARQQGVTADSMVTVGKSWIELIRQVLRDGHDLLIAGTRRLGPFRSMLFGSTGMKLLRKCPCPVWVTQPHAERISSILVAHDLQPVGDLALKLGGSLAGSHDAQLHVFHAIRLPEMDDAFPSCVSADNVAKYRKTAEQHIAGGLQAIPLSRPARVHLEYGAAYLHILSLIERYEVDLLVMGTVARTGIAGFVTGNTAERLLPHVPCSVLALKPPGFVSPVTLE